MAHHNRPVPPRTPSQALIDAAKQQLLSNHSQLLQLSSKCSLPPADDEGVLQDFTEALAAWDMQAQQSGRSSHRRYAP